MGQAPISCCGAKSGPSAVVIFEESQGHSQLFSHNQSGEEWDGIGHDGADVVPLWLAELAPSLVGEQAARAARAWVGCAEDLRKRTRAFVGRSVVGVPCRIIDDETQIAKPAMYSIDEASLELTVRSLVAPTGSASSLLDIADSQTPSAAQQSSTTAAARGLVCRHHVRDEVVIKLADVRNIWLCSDSELARRAHGSLKQGALEADLSCVMLIDAPEKPIGVVELSVEAREEFLDCMAVLIATQRLRREPELARCKIAKGVPPPEAKLRPFGRSLQSVHLSGPICQWLAEEVGEHVLPSAEALKPFRLEGGIDTEVGAPLLVSRSVEESIVAASRDGSQPRQPFVAEAWERRTGAIGSRDGSLPEVARYGFNAKRNTP